MNNEIDQLKKRLERAEQLLEQWVRVYKEQLRYNSKADKEDRKDRKSISRYFAAVEASSK